MSGSRLTVGSREAKEEAVCHQVQVEPEPELQAVSDPGNFSHSTANVQDGARLDIAMNGFWGGRTERCFVDVRIFNPYAPSIMQAP